MATLNPNDPEWKGFVASMREHPADDTTRLAFADFVEERGGAAFAGFVRAMVDVAKTDPTNKFGVNHWEDRVLPAQPGWKKYADAERHFKSCWGVWSPVNKLAEEAKSEWRWHRGFPDKVVLDWRGLKFLDTLCAIGPVGEVEVVSGSPVTWEIFSNTIQWSIRGDPLAARCDAPEFVTGRDNVWPSYGAVQRSGLFSYATMRFLHDMFGKMVTRIWYSNKPGVRVWPTVAGRGVLLPHEDPFVTAPPPS